MDSLDELIQNGHMPPALALKILAQVRAPDEGCACVGQLDISRALDTLTIDSLTKPTRLPSSSEWVPSGRLVRVCRRTIWLKRCVALAFIVGSHATGSRRCPLLSRQGAGADGLPGLDVHPERRHLHARRQRQRTRRSARQVQDRCLQRRLGRRHQRLSPQKSSNRVDRVSPFGLVATLICTPPSSSVAASRINVH